jgi:hypothetical protein
LDAARRRDGSRARRPGAAGPDGNRVIFRQTVADPAGNFNFCPLPAGAIFDVVALAVNGSGAAYNATIAANVPGGTSLLNPIPLSLETAYPNTPTTFQEYRNTGGGDPGGGRKQLCGDHCCRVENSLPLRRTDECQLRDVYPHRTDKQSAPGRPDQRNDFLFGTARRPCALHHTRGCGRAA